MRKRLAIVEFTMSAGGVERVLQGLATALLEIPEAQDWDVTLLLSRYNSAHQRVEWPAALTGPRLHVEWMGEGNAISRAVDPLAHAQGLPGLSFTRIPGYVAARTLWKFGPTSMRAALGDRRALISLASRRFDAMLFTYPFWLQAPPLHCAVLSSPSDFNFKYFLPEGSLRRRIHEKALRSWLERSDRLLVYGEAMADELRRFYPEHAGKTFPVQLGVTTGRPAPAPDALAALRRERGLPERFALVTGWSPRTRTPWWWCRRWPSCAGAGSTSPWCSSDRTRPSWPTARPPGSTGPTSRPCDPRCTMAAWSSAATSFRSGTSGTTSWRGSSTSPRPTCSPPGTRDSACPAWRRPWPGARPIVSSIPPLLEQDRALGGAYRVFDPDDARVLADHLAWVLEHEAEARAAARAAAERVVERYDWRARRAPTWRPSRRSSPGRATAITGR